MGFRHDDHENFHRRLSFGFFATLWGVILGAAVVAFMTGNPVVLLPTLLLLPLSARGAASAIADAMVNAAPRFLVGLLHRRWNGVYRAFDGWQVRIVEGENDTPSCVVADDLMTLLDQKVSARDRQKLAARFPGRFFQSADPLAEGLWVFSDTASIDYLKALAGRRDERADAARRLVLWLEREVFRSIDNRRTTQTGTAYPFTADGHIKGRAQHAPAAFRSEKPLPRPAGETPSQDPDRPV